VSDPSTTDASHRPMVWPRSKVPTWRSARGARPAGTPWLPSD